MLSSMIQRLIGGEELSAREMEEAFSVMTSGEVPHSQIGAFLAALQCRGASAGELTGAARMLRRAAEFIDCGRREVVDIVGTGGDGSGSINISTASAIVAAGAGVAIAKHGNRAATSRCGSADVLGALGYNLDAAPAVIEQSIAEQGIGFLFAAKLHPVLAKMAVIRRELKVRTIFNLLGPLCNPAGARAMVLGVYDAGLTELFAETLAELGVRRALVVHGLDGLDEISPVEATRVCELRDGCRTTYELLPELLLGRSYDGGELRGGEPAYNAARLRAILAGEEHSAGRAAVLLNAGAAIYVAGLAEDLPGGIRQAVESIDSGRAAQKLTQLLEASHGISA